MIRRFLRRILDVLSFDYDGLEWEELDVVDLLFLEDDVGFLFDD